MTLRVLTAGTGRSGSTWLHNAVVALLMQKHAVYGAWVDRWNDGEAAEADALVLKVHAPTQIGAFQPDIIVTCHRDLRDAALSLRDYQNLNSDAEILGAVAWARSSHDHFNAVADLDVAYEDMVTDPTGVLAGLARVLGVADPDLDYARLAVESWEPLSGDAKHRFDGRPGRWREQMTPGLLNAIEAKHGDWLTRFGYPSSGCNQEP